MPGEFEELRDRLRDFSAARGWGDAHIPRNLALALVGEVGELAAELQWVPDEQVGTHLRDPAARARLTGEIADVLIYLVRFADICGVDLRAAAYSTIERNETRFPPLPPPDGSGEVTPGGPIPGGPERIPGGSGVSRAVQEGSGACQHAQMDRRPHSYLHGELVIVLDCGDLDRSARFWTRVLGYVQASSSAGPYRTLLPADGNGIELLLQRVPEAKRAKSRLHLDLRTADLGAEVDRVTGLGARLVTSEPISEDGMRWHVLADPDGNEFCVLQPLGVG